MHTLPLTPLPFQTNEENRTFRQIDIEGFVDEQVVSRAIKRGAYDRTSAAPVGMVLSSSVEDYAGWAAPVESPFRKMAESPTPSAAPAPVPAAAPAHDPLAPRPWNSLEMDVGTPSQGRHRSWLFGMAGAVICGIIAASLLNLAQQRSIAEIMDAAISGKKWSDAPAAVGSPPAIQPSLTEALPAAR